MEGDACNPKRGYKLHLRLQQAHPGEQRGALPAEEAEPSFPGEGGETEGAFTGDRWAAQEDEGSGDDAVTAQRARAWCPWSVHLKTAKMATLHVFTIKKGHPKRHFLVSRSICIICLFFPGPLAALTLSPLLTSRLGALDPIAHELISGPSPLSISWGQQEVLSRASWHPISLVTSPWQLYQHLPHFCWLCAH